MVDETRAGVTSEESAEIKFLNADNRRLQTDSGLATRQGTDGRVQPLSPAPSPSRRRVYQCGFLGRRAPADDQAEHCGRGVRHGELT